MTYINAGASYQWRRVKTKAELKRLLKAEPQNVTFDTTSLHAKPETVIASDLGNRPHGASESWSIVGPDPYSKRDWYATVKVNAKKNLVVT